MSFDRLAQSRAIAAQDTELERCKRSLWYLATEKLHRDKLTVDFHKPMMDQMDERRALRRAGKLVQNEAEFWARDYFKTTVRECQVIQDWLWEPLQTMIWWHDVEDRAIEAGSDIAGHFQKNKEFRKMVPELCPAPLAKRFYSGGELRLPINRRALSKPPSLRCFGRGSEATGGHSDVGYLDDIIGLNAILDNEMPKVRLWLGASVTNVIETTGYLLATGTRWDEFDVYSDWLKSGLWLCRVRGCYETDGAPDWNGQPVLYSRALIERKRAGMSEWEFASQMMNDPRPSGEMLWQGAACEHYTTLGEIRQYEGRIFVFTDTAPANVGSMDAHGEKDRRDGTKNAWTVCAVKIQTNGERQEIVLLDLQGSKDWSIDEGFDAVCTMARKWHTGLIGYERVGNADEFFQKNLLAASRRVGLASMTPFEMTATYDGKRPRFAMLASKAFRQEFLIAESVPAGSLQVFLEEARAVRFLGARNTARFDDYYDVVSFACDPAVQRYSPQPDFMYDRDEDDYRSYVPSRVRHISGV